jgi:hypothetical protein
LNDVSRQNEENTVRANTKPVAITLGFEFEHIAAKILAHRFQALANIPARFSWKSAQLVARFFTDSTSATNLNPNRPPAASQ